VSNNSHLKRYLFAATFRPALRSKQDPSRGVILPGIKRQKYVTDSLSSSWIRIKKCGSSCPSTFVKTHDRSMKRASQTTLGFSQDGEIKSAAGLLPASQDVLCCTKLGCITVVTLEELWVRSMFSVTSVVIYLRHIYFWNFCVDSGTLNKKVSFTDGS